MTEPEAERIAVALSGGGHRASLFGLGVLMYLVAAGRNKDVVNIASVSGGSMTNGVVAQNVQFRATDTAGFNTAVVRPFAGRIARQGTLLAPLLTKLYLALVVLALPATLLPLRLTGISPWWRALLVALCWVAWGQLFRQRANVCAQAFRSTLFSPNGKTTPLAQIAADPLHIICATELRTAESVYFSRDFIYGYGFEIVAPGELPLYRAVQASADFPGGFPPVWLRTPITYYQKDAHSPQQKIKSLVLADGGVYDNMGDQWAMGFVKRANRGPRFSGYPIPNRLIVANASARPPWTPFSWNLVPLVGELLAFLRVNNVMYYNTTNLRRQEIAGSFDPGAPAEAGKLPGVLIQIAQSPFTVAGKYRKGDDAPAQRAQTVIAHLGPDTETAWAEIARRNAAVATTLRALGVETSVDLLRHGFVLAMCNLHVIFGEEWPLVPVPTVEAFTALVEGGGT